MKWYTNYTNLFSNTSEGEEFKMGFTHVKFNCYQRYIVSGGSEGESISYLSQLLEATFLGLWPASSKPVKASPVFITLHHSNIDSFVSLFPI